MRFGSSDIVKPILWFLWFDLVVILIIYVLKGQLSVEGAAFRGILVLVGILAWTIGLHQYLFSFGSHGTRIATQFNSLLIRFISSLLYLALFVGIFFFDENSRTYKAQYMIILSIMSLAWAFLLYRRIRFLEDTSHSSLNSAAQGYAVLKGKVTLYEGEIVRGPHKELPAMVWYSKYLNTSSAGFLLNDDKGFCTIDPRDAEVITPRHHYGSYAYYAIYPDETIYVLGQLETLNKQRNEYERKALVTSKIVRWKRQPARFLDYFDRNNDGAIDEGEMETVRNAATRSVEDSLEELYQQPASHVVSRPTDGRPFIISSIHPDELLTRYKRAMFFHFSAWIVLTIFALAMQVQ
jgi:hypothetical protein